MKNFLIFFKKNCRWIILFLVILIFGFYLLKTRSHSSINSLSKSSGGRLDMGDTGELFLQVPLNKTLAQRGQFIEDLKGWKDVLHMRPLYEKWIDVIGANGIIKTLETASPDCHDLGHDLGRLIYSRVGNIGDSLRTCEQVCNSGCMHGVLMEFFHKDIVTNIGVDDGQDALIDDGESDHVTMNDIKSKMSTICGGQDVSGNGVMASDYKQGDCAHGVGHAVMFLSGYNIPRAIGYCRLFDSDQLAYYCSTGAYMEYVTTHDAVDLLKHKNDIFYPCDKVDYPSACFRYKMAHVVPRFYQSGGTLGQLQKMCLNLKGKYQIGCFHGLGNGHFAVAASNKISLDRICSAGNHDDQYVCTEGLIERLGRYIPDNAARQCDTVSGWQRDLCLDDARHELYDLKKPFELYIQ